MPVTLNQLALPDGGVGYEINFKETRTVSIIVTPAQNMASDERDNITLNMLQKEGPTATQPEGRKMNQYLAATIAALGAVTIGTGLAWTSPVLPILTSTTETSVLNEPVDRGQASLIGSLIAIGAIFGALPAGSIADKFGRKPVILAFCIPFIISWVLILFAKNVLMLFAARFIAGVATGGLSAIIPMFIGEIAESSIRGALGSFFQMFLTLGILYLYCLGLSTYTVIAIGCLAVPILLLVLFFLVVPETPIYLMKSGNNKKAEVSLRFYRGSRYDVPLELAAIQREIDAAARKKASFSDLVSSRANLRALIISLGLMVFQQFSGVNAVIFYSNDIFKSAGSTLDPGISAIIVGIVQFIMTALSVVLVDKAGRRILLLLSDFVMALCLGVLGFYFYMMEDGKDVSSISFLPLLSVIFFIVMFSLGYGPIPWMMVGELFAPEVKGSATGIAVALNWISAFIVTLCFVFLVKNLGSAATFWIFSVICFVGTLFTFVLVPETKGKTLNQIQRELGGGK